MTPDRWSKTAALTVGVFGFLINLAQFLDLKRPTRLAVGVGTAACVVGAAIFFFRAKKYENALCFAKFPKRLASVTGFRLEYVSTEAAFAEISKTSETIYGGDNVPLERSLSWWKQYRRGTFVAYWDAKDRTSEIAGYVSMWPVKKSTYQKLRKGHLREGELSYRSIEGDSADCVRKYWYVSNIVVARARRRLLPELLAQAIGNWIQLANLGETVSALAFAYSTEGEDLLGRFGFRRRTEKSGDGWPIFELETTTSNLKASLERALSDGRRAI